MRFAFKKGAAAQLLSVAFLLASFCPAAKRPRRRRHRFRPPRRAAAGTRLHGLPAHAAQRCRAEMKLEDTNLELRLEQAIAIGLRDNRGCAEVAASAQAARSGADIAFAPFLPELNAGYRYSGFNAPVIPGGLVRPGLAAMQACMRFSLAGSRGAVDAVRLRPDRRRLWPALSRARIDELTSVRARQTVAFDVACGCFDLLFAQAFVRVHEQAVKQAEAILKDTKVRKENGTADREAVLRAEVEVTSAQERLVAARQRVSTAWRT